MPREDDIIIAGDLVCALFCARLRSLETIAILVLGYVMLHEELCQSNIYDDKTQSMKYSESLIAVMVFIMELYQ